MERDWIQTCACGLELGAGWYGQRHGKKDGNVLVNTFYHDLSHHGQMP